MSHYTLRSITHKISNEFQTMRYLENCYDKTEMKFNEGGHLKRIYDDIKRKLEVVRIILFELIVIYIIYTI